MFTFRQGRFPLDSFCDGEERMATFYDTDREEAAAALVSRLIAVCTRAAVLCCNTSADRLGALDPSSIVPSFWK